MPVRRALLCSLALLALLTPLSQAWTSRARCGTRHDTHQSLMRDVSSLRDSMDATWRQWTHGIASTALATVFLVATPVHAGTTTIIPKMRLDERIRPDTVLLVQPPVSTNTANTINDPVVYPPYLLGTWRVTQTLVAVQAPLGLEYAGGPNGVRSIGAASLAESRARLGVPVSLTLRYLPANTNVDHPWVVEDRLYNTRQRLDSFAGKTVVANVVYDVPQTIVSATPPRSTTIVYFKGPVAQKTMVTAHHDASTVPQSWCTEKDDDNAIPWTGFELQRSLFALTNANPAPPIATDTEVLVQYTPDCSTRNHVTGRLRLAGYLNPGTDALYFAAHRRAVTIQDYTLDLVQME